MNRKFDKFANPSFVVRAYPPDTPTPVEAAVEGGK